MNTSNLKRYAPQARRDFKEAVSRRLNALGISANSKGQIVTIEPHISGSIMQIGSNNFDAKINGARNRLINACNKSGFDAFVEHVAYTWFNRLCAIRYMELHDYLDHGFRVLSHPNNPTSFEILDHAQDVAEALGLDRSQLIELKLAGNKDEELYRELLLGQCHALHVAMPFLFEALDDEAELLLPDNLTRTDSLIRGLIDEVPEEDWEQVEVIGWLYQFYISEKKDQVIGKVVKSEDIPAATQLFTPNWIVKYLVQNSVGRHWLQTYPDSDIKSQMEYYIEPAEQTPEVIEQLKAITPESIEPESIKVLDPACGSGHILIEAYNVLKAIYEERGYRSRDIPKLILENNLFGLDIDDRAAQLAGFALMMMARNDDKRIFTRNVRLHVLSLQESNDIELPKLWKELNLSGDGKQGQMQDLFAEEPPQDINLYKSNYKYQILDRTLKNFIHAKTLGSLIDIPTKEQNELLALICELDAIVESGDILQKQAAKKVRGFINQASILSRRFDAVIANPPYMGSNGMNLLLKNHAKTHFKDTKNDLFATYIERCIALGKDDGIIGLVTPYVWMFIGSYEKLREKIVNKHTLTSLIQLEYNAFAPACIPVCSYIIQNKHISNYSGSYIRLSEFKGHENQAPKTLEAIKNRNCGWFFETKPDYFKLIAGMPIGYWIRTEIFEIFSQNKSLKDVCYAGFGIKTGNNELFMREWHEVSLGNTEFNQVNGDTIEKTWYPCASGGIFRKWYGNHNLVVNFYKNGLSIEESANKNGNSYGFNGSKYYFKKSITWPKLTSSINSFRSTPDGNIFDGVGLSAFFNSDDDYYSSLALLNSNLFKELIAVVAPTLSFTTGDFYKLPFINIPCKNDVIELIKIHKNDWDSFERSRDFLGHEMCTLNFTSAEESYNRIITNHADTITKTKQLEEKINSMVNIAFQANFISNEVPAEQISLTINRNYRFGSNDLHREQSTIFEEFISYFIGCSMGRYSLDKKGLVYAFSDNEGFTDLVSEGAYASYPADEDGIIPLTDQEWFKDDATNRFREFVKVVWGEEHLQENLDFVAKSLCLNAIKPKKSEPAMETIRRYLSTQFYKDHLKTYKKRPIYWLFSSGKQKAFECLVYLHRYNEGTLSRMRTEYVTPLLGKYDAYIDQLKQQVENADSTAEANRLKKEQDALIKKQVELREFDDKLKHYADMRISLDLDDGVKVNYGKFGDLLSDVKAITGSDSGAE